MIKINDIYTIYGAKENIKKGDIVYFLDKYEGTVNILNSISIQKFFEMEQEPVERYYLWTMERGEENDNI